TLIYWWATKRRYPPYIDLLVGNKKTLPAPYIDLNLNGGQQKDVTHPTLIYWWATKTRYPPYIDLNLNGGQQKDVTHPTLIYWWATKRRYRPPTLI
ncbi:MAG: hypothetical protein DRR00_29270, partial [Candidatus Parabeggiatoa sp. nov. 3]